MRRMLPTAVVMLIVALLFTLSMPVQATKPTTVTGDWCWMAPSADFEVTKVADGNVFISAVEVDQFTGTLVGTGLGTFTLTVHPEGFTTGSGRTLFTGTVLGESGSVFVRWTGNTKNDLGYWWFHWVIQSGTGDLADLRGQGIGWGPGPADLDEFGCADLSGKVHLAHS